MGPSEKFVSRINGSFSKKMRSNGSIGFLVKKTKPDFLRFFFFGSFPLVALCFFRICLNSRFGLNLEIVLKSF